MIVSSTASYGMITEYVHTILGEGTVFSFVQSTLPQPSGHTINYLHYSIDMAQYAQLLSNLLISLSHSGATPFPYRRVYSTTTVDFWTSIPELLHHSSSIKIQPWRLVRNTDWCAFRLILQVWQNAYRGELLAGNEIA